MPTPSAAKHDSALRREIIAYWVEVATAFGFQRSWGEIYGLIFASEQPLCADDITATLDMSRSGVGQGLKALLEIGAIRPAHQLGSRKDHYQLQPDLGVLVKQLLNSRVFPRLEELARTRAALAETAKTGTSPHLRQRFEKLQRWHAKASPALKLLKALA